MIKALLVDDEPRALKSLRLLLEKHCPEVQILNETDNIHTAFQLIFETKPQVIFLDINMPNGSGLELLEKIQDLDVEVIFTTAHQEHALKALKLSALDYLLKPINQEELRSSIEKFIKRNNYPVKNYALVKEILNGGKLQRIAINSLDGIKIIEVSDILYLESDRNYSTFHYGEQRVIASKPLGEYEKMLKEHGFVRIHRSTLINLDRMKEYKRGKDSRVLLDNGTELEVSRNRKEELLTNLSRLS